MPATRPAVTTPVTAGIASAQALGAQTRDYLMIANVSATATIYVAFTIAAVVNGAGSFVLGPGAVIQWVGGDGAAFVPSDAINIIASAAATPVTIIT